MECERELYSASLSSPGRYQSALLATRALLSQLKNDRAIESIDSMERHWSSVEQYLSTIAMFRTDVADGLAPKIVLGAAFALRDRELRSLAVGLQRLQAVRTAETSGQTWVRLDSPKDQSAWLGMGRQWMEIHCASLRALICTIEYSQPQLTVSYAVIDGSTGSLLDPQNSKGDIRVTDESLFDSTLADERRCVELF